MRAPVLSFARSAVLAAAANIVSIAFAAWVLPGFTIKLGWFAFAVVFFTILTLVLRGIVMNLVSRFTRASVIVGGLVLTYLGLLITDRATPAGGFAIEGWATWLGVTVMVWAASIAYGEVDQHAPPEIPPVRR